MLHVGFPESHAIHINFSIDQAQAIPGNAHHTLYKVFTRMNRIMKNHDIPAVYRPVGQEAVQEPAAAIT